jgi:chromosome segregation ATPase
MGDEDVNLEFSEELEKKWIQKSDVKQGALGEWCKSQGFAGVCQACINKAAKAGGHPAKMASFACNMPNSPYTYPKKEQNSEEVKMEEAKEEMTNVPPAQVEPEKLQEEVKVEEVKAEEKLAETPVEQPTEVKTEPVSEVKVEEKPAEAPVEEKKVEAPVAEAPVEEVKEETPEEKKEALAVEIKQTESELAIIKEVRDELVNLYSQYGEVKKEKEALSKKIEELSNEKETLKAEIVKYKEAEEKLNAQKKTERLEKLSAKFKLLGQEKSVEQLAEKDDGTIGEFEKIVDAAIEKSGETKPLPEVTTPSQGVESTKAVESEATKASEDKVVKKVAPTVPVSNHQFFAGILNTMAREQLTEKRNKKGKLL